MLPKVSLVSLFRLRRYSTSTTVNLKPFKYHKLDVALPKSAEVSKKDATLMYYQMAVIRKMERIAAKMYRKQLIRGFCHLYIGQEACAVGIHAAMRPNDSAITTYRCHAWTYLMVNDVRCCIAELLGVQSGVSRGKGGSMHMYTHNFYGGNAIVGAQTPQGAGIALAHKYLGDGGVCITIYGDGAANQGQLYEAFNMAKIWKLPCIFLCENNQYAMGTSLARGAGSSDFYARADYIPGIWVDGMDLLSVREAAKFAVQYCSSGKGPLVMETSTYRFTGHSMSDPDMTYRTRDEVKQKAQTNDPIKLFSEQMVLSKLATPEEIKQIDVKVNKEVEDAAKKATADKELPVADLTYDIYEKNVVKEQRGVLPWSTWKTGNRPKSELMNYKRLANK